MSKIPVLFGSDDGGTELVTGQSLSSIFTVSRSTVAEYLSGQGVMESAPADTARFGFKGAGDNTTDKFIEPGLIIETASTNVFDSETTKSTLSLDLSSGDNLLNTQNDEIGTDGNQTATSIYTLGTGTGNWLGGYNITSPGTGYSFSANVKRLGNDPDTRYFILGFRDSSFTQRHGVKIDLLDGTVIPVAQGDTTIGSVRSIYFGNGWYRVEVNDVTYDESTYGNISMESGFDDAFDESWVVTSGIGDGTGGVAIEKLMFESNSVSTSWTADSRSREFISAKIAEPTSFNAINSTMEGASAPSTFPTGWDTSFTASGISLVIEEIGKINDADYIDVKISGTPASTGLVVIGFADTTTVDALDAQDWTLATDIQIISGSLTNFGTVRLNLSERTSSGAFIKDNTTTISLDSNLETYTNSFTLSGGGTTAYVQPRFQMAVGSGDAVDITLRFTKMQAEERDEATEYIPSSNVIKNKITNSVMNGANAVTNTLPTDWSTSAFSGLSSSLVGFGHVMLDGEYQNYVDIRYSGTGSSSGGNNFSFGDSDAIAAAEGQVWAGSFYAAIVGGSTANIEVITNTLRYRDSGSTTLLGSAASITLTDQLQRFENVQTAPASTAYVQDRLEIGHSSGAVIDITIRIVAPQTEQSSSATAFQPTFDGYQARAYTPEPWFNPNKGTIYLSWERYKSETAFAAGVSFNTGSGSDSIRIAQGSSGSNRRVVGDSVINDVDQSSVSIETGNENIRLDCAFSYEENNLRMSVNGSDVASDTSALLPVELTEIRLGGQGSTELEGWIYELKYYDDTLTDEQLINMSYRSAFENVYAWQDAATATSITESSNDVSVWGDLSGNSYDSTQDTSANQPGTGTATQNGLNVLTFDGNDALQASSYLRRLANQNHTLFVVARRDSEDASFDSLISVGSGTTNNLILFYSSTSGSVVYRSNAGSGGVTLTGVTNTDMNLFTCYREDTTQSISLNGGTEVTDSNAVDAGAVTDALIGNSLNNLALDGDIAEIIIADRSMTDIEKEEINNHLMYKWGIAKTPQTIGNIGAQWDASLPSTYVSINGKVSSWNDYSGNGNTATQSNSAQQFETGVNTLNGLNVMTLDGSASMVVADSESISPSSEATFVLVGQVTDFSSPRNYLSKSFNNSYRLRIEQTTGDSWILLSDGTLQTFTSTSSITAGSPFILSTVVDLNSSPDISFFIDGESAGTASTSKVSIQNETGNLYIGDSDGSGTEPFLGFIGEIVIFNSALDNEDTAGLYNHLRIKWGL